MKRKTSKVIGFLLISAFALAGCNLEVHEHSFSEEWSKDSDSHWHEATCKHTEEVSDKELHNWDEGTVTTEATCNSEGVKTLTCKVCDYTKTESISKLLHNWETTSITREATCGEEGEKIMTCSLCKEETTAVISKLSHTYSGAWTSDETNHWHAANCGHDLIIDEEPHKWDKGVFSNENGPEKTYTCEVCGTTKLQSLVEYNLAEVISLLGENVQYITANHTETSGITVSEDGKTANIFGVRLTSAGESFPDSLIEADLTGLETSSVTDMQFMFYKCYNLTSIDVSGFDTSNVTDMHDMFYDCESLTSVDVSGFDTSKVINMQFMFSGCSNLTSIDVSRFNTSSVTNMWGMFTYCSNLTSLDVSGFDTASVTTMYAMFSNCSNLTSLDLSSFNTSNVTNMGYMFYYCSSLTSLDLSSFNTLNVTSYDNMFDQCYANVTINQESWNENIPLP